MGGDQKANGGPPMGAEIIHRSLEAIGAEEHQAVAVCHNDREHKHIHLVINRIHPVTAKPLDEFRDLIKLEKYMRSIEHLYLLTPVEGRHSQPIGRQPEHDFHRPAKHPDRRALIARTRPTLNRERVFAAKSWEELHEAVKPHGHEIDQLRGKLAVRTYDGFTLPVSDIFPEFKSLKEKEEEFGKSLQQSKDERQLEQEARRLGLSTSDLIMLLEDRRTRAKAKARRQQVVRVKAIRTEAINRTKIPARIATDANLNQDIGRYYGPAITETQLRETLKRLTDGNIIAWEKLTRNAAKALANELTVEANKSLPTYLDQKDALFQIQRALEVIGRYMLHQRSITKQRQHAPQRTPTKGMSRSI